MVFSSITTLFFFLPIAVCIYLLLWLIFKKHMVILNAYLCFASLVFYWWGDTKWHNTNVIVLLIIVNYFFSYIIRTNINMHARRISAVSAIVFDCYILARFKYPLLILSGDKLDDIIFPLGISFIIFHCISYIVDVYKMNVKTGDSEAVEFVNFALYVSFFPKLTQGPIVQYNDMRPNLRSRVINLDNICDGISRFVLGLSKKVLLADSFGATLNLITNEMYIDTPTAWLSMILYGMQLYFDFSGYSDMALGLAKIFGFEFKENFDFPYISTSISEFWRRWHISLGDWFKKYIYIPLGGNRTGSIYVNLLVVFFLTGIWHGNTEIYIFWGMLMGVANILERTKVYTKLKDNVPGFKVIGYIQC